LPKPARKKEGVYSETQAVIKKHASRKGMLGSERAANAEFVSLKTSASKLGQKKSKLLKINTKQQNLF
jgi:hypothetical protein